MVKKKLDGTDHPRTNHPRIKKFVNLMLLYITCKKSAGLHIAEAGLMAGRQTKFGQGLTYYNC